MSANRKSREYQQASTNLESRWEGFREDVKILWRSIQWTAITAIAGLLQIWLTILVCVAYHKTIPYDKILEDGSLLFFACAIVASILTDYLFFPVSRPKTEEFTTNAALILFPFFIIIPSASVYSINVVQEVDREFLQLFNAVILFTAAVYTLLYKSNFGKLDRKAYVGQDKESSRK